MNSDIWPHKAEPFLFFGKMNPNSNVSRYSGIMVTWSFSAMMVLSTGSSQANAAIFPDCIAATMSL